MARVPRPLPASPAPGRRARWRRGVLRRVLVRRAGRGRRRRSSSPSCARRRRRSSPVVVAARDVTAGTVLPPPTSAVEPCRSDAAQPGALTAVADAVGRRVGAGLAPRRDAHRSRLVPRGALDGLPPVGSRCTSSPPTPPSVDLLAPGAAPASTPWPGGRPRRGAVVLATDPPGAGDPRPRADRPPAGVVLSLTPRRPMPCSPGTARSRAR